MTSRPCPECEGEGIDADGFVCDYCEGACDVEDAEEPFDGDAERKYGDPE